MIIARQTFVLFLLLLLPSSAAIADEQRPTKSYEVRGRVGFAEGRDQFPGRAVVFVCHSESGFPVLTKAAQQQEDRDYDWQSWVHAVTDEQGAFVIPELPAGKYRFIAQSWAGTEGLPEFQGKTSSTVYVHGVADDVSIPDANRPDAHLNVAIRPLGDETVRITADPKEASAFLILSTGRTIGDPILGLAGWGTDFLQNAFLVTHLSSSSLLVVGLPKGVDVTASAFYYDNVPGTGGVTWTSGEQDQVTFRIYSGWSNAHDEAPPRLERLTSYMKAHPGEYEDVLSDDDQERFREALFERGAQAAWETIGGPSRTVDIRQFGPTPLVDIIAANSYAALQRHHEALERRRKQEN